VRNGLKFALGALLGAAAFAALYAGKLAREQVQLDRFVVPVARKGLPGAGLTILHLTDFHFKAGGRIQQRKEERLRSLLRSEKYDVIAVTGDVIHDLEGLPAAIALMKSLEPRWGTYFVPGNHDYAEYTPWGVLSHTWRESARRGPSVGDVRKLASAFVAFARKVVRNELVRQPVCFNDVPAMLAQLEAVGVTTLVNRSTPLPAEAGAVWFAGVDDDMESHPDLAAALNGIPPAAPVVLLAHNPDIWLQCGVDRADLVLSGHTHGGQIKLPVMGAVHTQGTHLSRKQPAGWFERGRSKMFVSRGLGESIPLRFGARPQVALIRLVGTGDEGCAEDSF
jgi:predicted MPP superfamily phosphohydrolase